MKLRVYHAGDGDCLLVTNGTGTKTMLVDGGRAGTFRENTVSDLTMDTIDVICVSHIDDDHITGILTLFDHEIAWRKHEFRAENDLPTREPAVPRPPEVTEIWHNALFEMVGPDLVLKAQNALATTSQLLHAQGRHDEALANENIALGERAGLELARRVSSNQLDIPLNKAANGRLLKRESARGRRFDRMRVKVIGPSQDDIDRLRVRWKKWIDDHPSAIDELRDQLRGDEAGLAAELGAGASQVSAPNLASIMLFLEEGRTESILLTGDGAADEILTGMEEEREIEPVPEGADLTNLEKKQRRHVTVFKIPHHGALANVTEPLVHRITADHYVFCGNGAHHNPELEVVRRIAEVRRDGIGPPDGFTFWFTSASTTPGLTESRKKHMQEIEALVDDLIAQSGGQMSATFMGPAGFFDVLP